MLIVNYLDTTMSTTKVKLQEIEIGQIETLKGLLDCEEIRLDGDTLFFSFSTGEVVVRGYDADRKEDRVRLAAVASSMGFGRGDRVEFHLRGLCSGAILTRCQKDST